VAKIFLFAITVLNTDRAYEYAHRLIQRWHIVSLPLRTANRTDSLVRILNLVTRSCDRYTAAIKVLRTIAASGHLLSDSYVSKIAVVLGKIQAPARVLHRSLWKGLTLGSALDDCQALLRATSHIIGHEMLDSPGGETDTMPRAIVVMIVTVVCGFDTRSADVVETAREAATLCERQGAPNPARLFELYVDPCLTLRLHHCRVV
jgi:hypothetical protein